MARNETVGILETTPEYDYIIPPFRHKGGAANGQKAFDTLCAIGHSEVAANTPPGVVTAMTPARRSNPNNPESNDPADLNKCAHCEKRGHFSGMFICDGCACSFHPGCVSEDLPRDDNDHRFQEYLCPMCVSQRHLFPPYSLD